METSISANNSYNISKVKQPKPSVEDNTAMTAADGSPTYKIKEKKEFLLPKVGVVDAPKISTTPLADTLTLNKAENPHTIYKLSKKNNKELKLQNILSIIMAACGIIGGISLIKKK